jgi:hypothetical protein
LEGEWSHNRPLLTITDQCRIKKNRQPPQTKTATRQTAKGASTLPNERH